MPATERGRLGAQSFSGGDARCERRRGLGGLVAVCVVLTIALSASPARAADDHSFDPVRSLTGDTSVSPDDETPDPGSAHPGRFNSPCGVTVDRHGYFYVASAAFGADASGTSGRIDVFDPQGNYVTQIKDENQPCGVAVDSAGNLYVFEYKGTRIVLFSPDAFPPNPGSIYSSPVTVATGVRDGVAVDPTDDHLYVASSDHAAEYDSAANGSGLLDDTIGTGSLDGRGPVADAMGIDVCGSNGDIYIASSPREPYEPDSPRVYVLSGAPGHTLKHVIDGSNTPDGGFDFSFGKAGVAVDQANCDVYVSDVEGSDKAVNQFDASGSFITQIKHNFKPAVFYNDIAIDNATPGQIGYDSPNLGYVYVTSASGLSIGNTHLYAFEPKLSGPPEITEQVASLITESEAVLRAKVKPSGLPTTYHFEVVSVADFEDSGYAGALQVPVPEASAGEGGTPVAVAESVEGLSPGTAYRFRLVATNEECTTSGAGQPCEEGDDAIFVTYPKSPPSQRGYELVSPPDTNGRIPTSTPFGTLRQGFATEMASPGKDSLIFAVEGGALPGLEGGGFYDSFEAVRDGRSGWHTRFAGLTGAQAPNPYPGGVSSDHSFAFWSVEETPGNFNEYLRRPDGGIEPVGIGSLGEDLHAAGSWISPGGGHVIFVTGLEESAVRLEPDAPPSGTRTVYDRTPGGATRVISLLPGEETPEADAEYVGASADGTVVAFTVEGTLYVRLNNERTVEVAVGNTVFGGLSSDGGQLFYLRPNPSEPLLEGAGNIPQGEIFAFDTATGETTQVGSGAESVLVNVSADGSHAYFTSPKVLDDGEEATAGEDNLYAWSGGAPRFVATLQHIDVTGEGNVATSFFGGLGLWTTYAVAAEQGTIKGPTNDPSRTTPDGSALVFESRANLAAPYDNGGHAEIYRYDDADGDLACISCTAAGALPSSSASLVSRPPQGGLFPIPPVTALSRIPNITDDGEHVFFQSAEPLVAGDVDGWTDVYEWQAGETGDCPTMQACLGLVSSGNSSSADYLYAMTSDGHDVFFLSGDVLAPQDADGTPSIYDARVDGGFAPVVSPLPCEGEDCQGSPADPPTLQVAANAESDAGRKNGPTRCAKGKRAVRHNGKRRCVTKNHKGAQRHKKHRHGRGGPSR